MSRCLSRVAILAALVPVLVFAQEPEYRAELIFPLETIHNHSSSIVQTPDGNLLVCWYHGSGERTADDVVILGSRKRPGEGNWEKPFLMADVPGFPDCNPTLFVDVKGRVWLFWVSIYANKWGTALLKYRYASDSRGPGAPRWDWQDVIMLKPLNFRSKLQAAIERLRPIIEQYPSGPERAKQLLAKAEDRLTRRMGWMTRTHPITLPSGRILVPLYTDVFSVGLMAVSDDSGKSWYASEPLVGLGAIQPSVVRRRDGTLVAFMRDNGPRHRIQTCESHDGGVHWNTARFLELPNPGSSVDVLGLRSGHWLLVCNDTKRGRHSLAVLLSDDEGQTWKWRRHLELDEPGQGSYSYPSIVQTKDGLIHVTYSYSLKGRGESIKHAVFNEAWIRQGDQHDSGR